MGVVESSWLTALADGAVGRCYDFSSAELRRATGPRARFESLLRTMPEYRALLNVTGYDVLSRLQVGRDRWKCRLNVHSVVGSVPYTIAYTWEVTLHDHAADGLVVHDLGQCMRHKKAGFTGVVVGWDATCAKSEEYCTANEVDLLPGGRQQPFYHVFVHGRGEIAYVAQEEVVATPPRAIDHPQFGEFFHTEAADEESGVWKPKRTLREWYPRGLEGRWLVNRVFPDKRDEYDA